MCLLQTQTVTHNLRTLRPQASDTSTKAAFFSKYQICSSAFGKKVSPNDAPFGHKSREGFWQQFESSEHFYLLHKNIEKAEENVCAPCLDFAVEIFEIAELLRWRKLKLLLTVEIQMLKDVEMSAKMKVLTEVKV